MRFFLKVCVCLILLAVLLLNSGSAYAALLTFTDDGEVYWNVLGVEDDSTLEVKKVADQLVAGSPSSVSLSNNGDSVYLSYGPDGKKVDVTDYKDNIVELEEKGSRKLGIKATEDGFSLSEQGVIAETSFPIKVNSPENKLAVSTSTGERFLGMLPYDAVAQLIRTKIISSVKGEKISLVENQEGEVAYVVEGEKQIALFNIINIKVPIRVEISAISGTVLEVKEPLWYSVVDFLLV